MLWFKKRNLCLNFELFLTIQKRDVLDNSKEKTVEVKIQFIHCYLQNTVDIANNFCLSEEDKLDCLRLNSTTPWA